MVYVYPYLVVAGYYLWFYLKIKKNPNYRGVISFCNSLLILMVVYELKNAEIKAVSPAYLNVLFAFALLFIPSSLQIFLMMKVKPKSSKASIKSELKKYLVLKFAILGFGFLISVVCSIVGSHFVVVVPKLFHSNIVINFILNMVLGFIIFGGMYLFFPWWHKRQKMVEQMFFRNKGLLLEPQEQKAMELWGDAERDSNRHLFIGLLILWIVYCVLESIWSLNLLKLISLFFPGSLLIGYMVNSQLLKRLSAQSHAHNIPWEVFVELSEKGIIRGRGFKKNTHPLFNSQK